MKHASYSAVLNVRTTLTVLKQYWQAYYYLKLINKAPLVRLLGEYILKVWESDYQKFCSTFNL